MFFVGKKVCGISAGYSHSAAITEDGFLYTWGCNDQGQLGHGDFKLRDLPTLNQSLLGMNVNQVACGTGHTLVTTEHTRYTLRKLGLAKPRKFERIRTAIEEAREREVEDQKRVRELVSSMSACGTPTCTLLLFSRPVVSHNISPERYVCSMRGLPKRRGQGNRSILQKQSSSALVNNTYKGTLSFSPRKSKLADASIVPRWAMRRR